MALTEYAFSDIFEFSRTTTKWIYNASNVLTEVAIDVAGFGRNGLTGGDLGILLEESVQQVYAPTDDPPTFYSSTPDTTFSGGTATGPDGNASMHKLVCDATTAAHYASKGVTLSGRQGLSWELYLKAGEFSRVQMKLFDTQETANQLVAEVDLVAETISGTAGGTATLYGVTLEKCANGVYRACLRGQPTTNVSQTGLTHQVSMRNLSGAASFLGDGTSGLYIGPQNLKVSKSSSTHIVTASGTTTRGADIMSATSLSPWFNATQGTVFVKASIPHRAPTGKNQVLVHFDDGTADNVIELRNPGGGATIEALIKSSGSIVFQATAGTFTPGTPFQVALAFAANAFGVSMDGATAVTDTAGAVPIGISRLIFGADDLAGGNALNGTLIDRYHYPNALTAGDLALRSA